MPRTSLVLASCLWVVGATGASPAWAQRTTASIRGTVIDQLNAVIPGATITVTNEETGLSRVTTTNEAGVYVTSELPVGRYTVQAELQGFKTASRTAIVLRVADDYAADFVLEPGTFSDTVTVEASSTPVKVLGGDVSGVVTGPQVRELPLNGRNFLQLTTLMPGVSAIDAFNVKDKGLISTMLLSVSGSDVTSNMWTVDGAKNLDVGANVGMVIAPSLEAIEEFKVLRNSYGPEFGGASGAQINIVTRSGTNQVHGSGFYSVRSDTFNARNYFLEQAHQPKDPLQRNDFGGSLGGPITKNRLFFFGSVEWNLEQRGTPRAAFVPTAQERVGDFSGPRIEGCSPPIPVDPLTGAPFPDNKIPADRLSQAAQLFYQLFPLPNVTPPPGSCNNWVTSIASPINWGEYNVRTDWTPSGSTRVMVRYTQDSWTNHAPSLYTNLWGDDPFPAVDSNWSKPSRSLVASLNQTLGATATNTLQFSYSANRIAVTRGGTNAGLNAQILAAMPSIYPVTSKLYGAESGHPIWYGGSGYTQLWNMAPFRNNDDMYIFKDDYTRVFGRHLVKAGALYSTNRKNEDTIGHGSQQYWSFWGAAGLNGWGATTGNVLADFLLRDMTVGFTEFSASRQAPLRWQDLEFYAADSWQVTPRVTLDYGVRYSVFYNPTWADNQATSFVPALYDASLVGDPCNGVVYPPDTNPCAAAGARGGTAGPNRSLMHQDDNNIAPRLGVAWDVSGHGTTAIRAGFGQFFLRERLGPSLELASNPPFTTVLTGLRYLDSTREPYAGAFGRSLGTPSVGRPIDQRTPNNWQWNVMFQHELFHAEGRSGTLEVGYVGNYGQDQLRSVNINQVLPGDRNGNGVDDRFEFATLPFGGNAVDLRPYSALGNKAITSWEHWGKTRYHSLQAQFISRFGRGSQFQASYTLARTRANVSMTNADGLSGADAPIDLTNPDVDWGRPQVGRTHLFNASLVWLLPALENASSIRRALLGDWEIATILGAASGQPFTAYAGLVTGLNGGPSGTGLGNAPPNRTDAPCRPNGGLPEQIINPAAYTLDGFQVGTIGSARRGDCTGPNYFQADLALYKNVPVTGRVKMQFRWDIFNVFNNTNFLFSTVNAAYSPTSATLSADKTTIISATPAGNFGQASRTRDSREMQFGLKLLW
jgi:hypothetical protein